MPESTNSARAMLESVAAELQLTMESVFVPFSVSRNKDSKYPNLNWKITLLHNGRPFLTTDYSAGQAHCPGYDSKARIPENFPRVRYLSSNGNSRLATDSEHKAHFRDALCAFECESGFAARVSPFSGLSSNGAKFENARFPIPGDELGRKRTRPITPDLASVLWSLTSDSEVLDYATFDQWACEFGYDPDSRNGEKIYRACLETALQMRAAIGESGIQKLREAGQDF